jgi:uncharacterized protein (TIGR04255 family)
MATIYRRAPITEAVIEIRTKTVLQGGEIDRVVARLGKKYPTAAQKLFEVSVEVRETDSKANQLLTGYRLASADGTRVVNVGTKSISTAKIAPYEGWERFTEEARANWDLWLKIVGWQPIERIGVRYINRIDVPTLGRFNLGEYLNFLPAMPRSLDNGIEHFAMNAVVPVGKDELKLVLNAGSTPSPLIGYQSLIVDLDVFRDTNLPTDEPDLWKLIDQIRPHKNDVFESCITDKTRALLT